MYTATSGLWLAVLFDLGSPKAQVNLGLANIAESGLELLMYLPPFLIAVSGRLL